MAIESSKRGNREKEIKKRRKIREVILNGNQKGRQGVLVKGYPFEDNMCHGYRRHFLG